MINKPENDFWETIYSKAEIQNKTDKIQTKSQLEKTDFFWNLFLAFRHFFVHAYGFMLDGVQLAALAQDAETIFADFKKGIGF